MTAKSQQPVPNFSRSLLLLSPIVLLVAIFLSCTNSQTPTDSLPHSSSVSVQSLASKHFYAGMPKPVTYPHTLLVLTNIGYVVGYDEQRKDPAWVCYRLFQPQSFVAPPRPSKFSVDSRTTAKVRHEDYTGSGFDRGHMAPNFAIAVCYGQRAQLETFLLSNIIPQKPRLNQQVWKNLEENEIRAFAPAYQELWVTTGPVFDASVEKLISEVEIPDACYKILADERAGNLRVLAFIISQDVTGSEKPEAFLTSVDDVERQTGLDFFSELPDEIENALEAQAARGMW